MFKRYAVLMIVATFGIAAAGCEKTTVENEKGQKLTIVKPANSTIKRGETEKVSIVVTRDNFTGPVTVKFDKLPNGVTVVGSDNTIESNERTFVLSASSTADLVANHVATVTASGPEGMKATQEFSITIKDKT